MGLPSILLYAFGSGTASLLGISLWVGISWQASVSGHACFQHPLTCFLSVLLFIMSFSSFTALTLLCLIFDYIYFFHECVYCFFLFVTRVSGSIPFCIDPGSFMVFIFASCTESSWGGWGISCWCVLHCRP